MGKECPTQIAFAQELALSADNIYDGEHLRRYNTRFDAQLAITQQIVAVATLPVDPVQDIGTAMTAI